MALTDSAARAMAVKMLTREQLNELHRREEKRGFHFLAYEIAWCAGKETRAHWGVPDNDNARAVHAERIEREIAYMCHHKKISRNMADIECRINFDWHVFGSGIDFAYSGAAGKSASRKVEEELEAAPY